MRYAYLSKLKSSSTSSLSNWSTSSLSNSLSNSSSNWSTSSLSNSCSSFVLLSYIVFCVFLFGCGNDDDFDFLPVNEGRGEPSSPEERIIPADGLGRLYASPSNERRVVNDGAEARDKLRRKPKTMCDSSDCANKWRDNTAICGLLPDTSVENICCFENEDCLISNDPLSARMRCYGAICEEGGEGRCLVPAYINESQEGCWTSVDCEIGEVCHGAFVPGCGDEAQPQVGQCVLRKP